MKATVKNMRQLCEIAVPGVFAYCTTCGARASASPGDYFLRDENEPLMCESMEHDGTAGAKAMVLAREEKRVVPA